MSLPENTWRVHIREVRYDEPNGVLVLSTFFYDMNELRVLYMDRSNYTFKGQTPCPHEEMRRLGDLLKNRKLNIQINDDPDRTKVTEENQMFFASTFNKKIREELDQVNSALQDPQKAMERRIELLIERERRRVRETPDN